jgi:formiminoglutamase
MSAHFHVYTRTDILAHTKLRRFVTRVGERVEVCNSRDDLNASIANSSAKYVLFGIPEDLGIRANMGLGGADTAWKPFLASFLNLQSNDLFSGEEVLILGQFDFSDMRFLIEEKALDADEKVDAYRHALVTVDEEVEELCKIISSNSRIPIAIGGGHNNAYPLIKGSSKGWHKAGQLPLAQINVINLDAHTDLRPIEGRHSGNGFRYAEEDGYLMKYFMIGLQECHLPQNILTEIVESPFFKYISFEEIFIHERLDFIQAIAQAIEFTDDMLTGIELDMDCIENVLSSAISPSGVSATQARQFITHTAARSRPAYLHICEGASSLEDGQQSSLTGKLMAYLVADFVKGRERLG